VLLSLLQHLTLFAANNNRYITYDEFRHAVESLDIDIEYSWIRSIVKRIDVEGDGYVSVEELSAAMEKTYEFNGIQGSPWKMYVNIAQQILQYHNVVTGEQIFEHDMTEALLKKIVRDNFIAETLVSERKRILRKKRKDWTFRNQSWAARKMQRMYVGRSLARSEATSRSNTRRGNKTAYLNCTLLR